MRKNNPKKIPTILLSILITTATILSTSFTASACTAVYIGSKVSKDGTTLIARSNDLQGTNGCYVKITERVENEPGRTMPIDTAGTVFEELPATTYRCISTPFFDSFRLYNEFQADAAVCTNEYGVSMTMSVTAYSNERALKADPLIEHGITEDTVNDLIICQSTTAKEATQKLLSLIDKYGSSEVNIAYIADQKEVWYIEMYTGHQYAAVKLPDDVVSVFGNEFSMEYLSDYEECILSTDLEKIPKDNGFAVYGKNNELNLLDTYSGPETVIDIAHMRTWIGHRILSPSSYDDYDKNAIYPLCFAPDKKVSLQDVMELMRNRYENTKYSPDETGRTDMSVIGTDESMSVHIIQIYPSAKPDMSTVVWASLGPAVYGVFVPISNASNSIYEAYGRNQSVEHYWEFDTVNYPYYRFKELNTLCIEKNTYEIYGKPVRKYWHEAETKMIAGMDNVLKKASEMNQDEAHNYVTNYCEHAQQKAFEDAGQILNDVRWFMSDDSSTLKNAINQKLEVLDEMRELMPIIIPLDPSGYSPQ
ncbi:C69 family dipeptidase [Butyrivibrio sp. XPD2002]|uniref:C69 family dipeptidase n=1 Tax=Butyrivibrio sp. XPD2002 TaxID=1280665 RepID=UPI000426A18F|nr:C69 family dipeptidase [Butyrivibrio sp. XPD2002]